MKRTRIFCQDLDYICLFDIRAVPFMIITLCFRDWSLLNYGEGGGYKKGEGGGASEVLPLQKGEGGKGFSHAEEGAQVSTLHNYC